MLPEHEAAYGATIDAARRRFLASCGKFALATPPAITLMLAAGERNYATAASGGNGGGAGGNHNGGNLQSNHSSASSGNANAEPYVAREGGDGGMSR